MKSAASSERAIKGSADAMNSMSDAAVDLSKNVQSTTIEMLEITKASVKFQISLEKQIASLKGQAAALKDPAIQKMLKEVQSLKSANDKLQASITGVTKATRGHGRAAKITSTSVLGLVKSLGALIITREVIRQFIDLSIAAKQAGKSMIALNALTESVGVSADKLVLSMQKVTKSQVSLTDLTRITNKAIALLGEQAIPQFEEIAEVAAKSAQVMGITVTKAFEDFVLGAGKQSGVLLKNLGLIVSQTTANENYALILGKTADQLTETERRQAFLNEALAQAREKYKDILIQADDVAAFNAKWADMKIVIGEALLPTLESLANAAASVIDNFRFVIEDIKSMGKEVEILVPKIKTVNDEIIGLNSQTGEWIFSTKEIIVQVVALGDELEEFQRKRRMVLGGIITPFDPSQIRVPRLPTGELIDDPRNIERAFLAIQKALHPNATAIKTLNERAKELRRTLKGLRDPEVLALIRETGRLEKQISDILNPSIQKSGETFEELLAEMRKTEDVVGVVGPLFEGLVTAQSDFADTLDETIESLRLQIDELNDPATRDKLIEVQELNTEYKALTDTITGVTESFEEMLAVMRETAVVSPPFFAPPGQDGLFGDGDKPVDLDIDETSLGLQFSRSLVMAFQSGSVVNAISQTLSAGVNFAATLSKAGAASGDPIIAGIALVASLFDVFGGGGKTVPVITKPFDVRIVEIATGVETKLLGITRRRVIAAGTIFGRGADARQELRLL